MPAVSSRRTESVLDARSRFCKPRIGPESGQSQCRMLLSRRARVSAECPESVLEACTVQLGRSQCRMPGGRSRLWTLRVIAACHASLLDTQSQRCMRGVSARCPESVLIARSRFRMPRVGPESMLNAWSRLLKPAVIAACYASRLDTQSHRCMRGVSARCREPVLVARSRFWMRELGRSQC